MISGHTHVFARPALAVTDEEALNVSLGRGYSFQGGGLLDDHFKQDGKIEPRPLEVVRPELERLEAFTKSPIQAYYALNSELKGRGPAAGRYLELLAAGKSPTHALDVVRAVEKLPPTEDAT